MGWTKESIQHRLPVRQYLRMAASWRRRRVAFGEGHSGDRTESTVPQIVVGRAVLGWRGKGGEIEAVTPPLCGRAPSRQVVPLGSTTLVMKGGVSRLDFLTQCFFYGDC